MKMKRRGCRCDALGVFGIEKATPKMAALPLILLGIPKKCGKIVHKRKKSLNRLRVKPKLLVYIAYCMHIHI